MKTIVLGCPATDLIATGFDRFPGPGELVNGDNLQFGAGGKTRNMAEMIARLSPPETVAMVGRTARDPYGLWKPPMDALTDAGVNTDYMTVLDYAESKKLPCIAFIPVDKEGNNQIFVLPGVSSDFSRDDIRKAAPLFELVGSCNGSLVLTIGHNFDTLDYAVKLAHRHGLKVMLDPGGLDEGVDIERLMRGAFLIKPNEHEAKMLTGIHVTDFASARQAATKLKSLAIENVLITAGVRGAYLFGDTQEKHIPIPKVDAGSVKDETGCGDQVMAALCAFVEEGKSFEEASEIAILAGTLQFHKSGIQPIRKEELLQVQR